MPKSPDDFKINVFINCPFDPEYKPLFEAIVFTVQIAGFRPRCAREASNAGQVRIDKILEIISECKYGIHDISKTEPLPPRFNMPLELGLDLGCKRFGTARQRSKRLLVLDRTPHRYVKFISDIRGQDIEPHNGRPKQIVRRVRDWLSVESRSATIPGGSYIYGKYRSFRRGLPDLCDELNYNVDELTFPDFCNTIRVWLEENTV